MNLKESLELGSTLISCLISPHGVSSIVDSILTIEAGVPGNGAAGTSNAPVPNVGDQLND